MGAEVVTPKEAADGGRKSTARYSAALRDITCCSLWAYALANTFLTDVDSLVFQYGPESLVWVWKFKFLIFLGLLATLIALGGHAVFAFTLFYLAFFPLILVVWRLPRLLIRLGSWSLALGILNATISFFHGLRNKIVSLFFFSVACAVVALSTSHELLIGASAVLFVVLMRSYYLTIKKSVFSPSLLLEIYRSTFAKARTHFSKIVKLENEFKSVPVRKMTPSQLEKRGQQLGQIVLFNRACVFAARKLERFHTSGFMLASGSISVFFLVILTTVSFGAINYSLYRINPSAFGVTTEPTLFTFVFYSFNALVHNFINEATPVSAMSHALWMLEGVFAIGIFVLFAAHFFTFNNHRYSAELAEAAKAIENEGRAVEDVLSKEWKLATIEDAMRELERIKSSLLAALVWLTKNADS